LREIAAHPLLKAEEEIALARQTAAGRDAARELASDPSLSCAREVDLRQQIEDGNRARRRLIESNLRLVVSVARHYQGRGLSLPDLIQEGNIGLQIGIDRYDWRKGFRLSTYVYWWIRQAITRALDTGARMIRLPVHAAELLRKAAAAEQRLQTELQREPTIAEVALNIGVNPDTLGELRARAATPASLDSALSGDSDLTRGDLVADDNALLALTATVEADELSDTVAHALQLLPEREREVICLHFGVDRPAPLTLTEIAQRLGVTRQRAQQLEWQALRRLRRNADFQHRLAS
jgi:RNA polymerase primary sigma factor